MCCDASREVLLFACRHHIYELVLKSEFETTMHWDIESPDIPLFKNFEGNCKKFDSNNIQIYTFFRKQHFDVAEITRMWKGMMK